MNTRPEQQNPHEDLPIQIVQQLAEMEAYSEIGMAKEALQIARHLLKQRPVLLHAFKGAVWTIVIQADQCQRWRRLVERAYAESPSGIQQGLRSDMLRFCVSLHDYELASQFIFKRPKTIDDLVFSLWTLLELRKIDEAKPLWRKCQELVEQVQDRFYRSMLIDVLAQYHAQIGELNTAEEYWVAAPDEEPFFENAARGLVKIEAIRGQYYAAAGQLTVERLDPNANRELDVMIPGNSKGRMDDLGRDLRKYSAALHRIVPERELWRFGIRTDE